MTKMIDVTASLIIGSLLLMRVIGAVTWATGLTPWQNARLNDGR